MSPPITKEIQETARKIVLSYPDGIRYTELASKIQEQMSNANLNTIGAQIRQLPGIFPEFIEKPSRGLYKPIEELDDQQKSTAQDEEKESNTKEEEIYEPFANFLTDDLEECSTAVAVGSMRANGKWGNPDVVGIYKPLAHHVVKFEPEIISAEIKVSLNDNLTGFGQAVAYRLFSHKTYLVLPDEIPIFDKSRLTILCDLYGIGLIYFYLESNSNNPKFTTERRATKYSPDMFLLNEFVENMRKSQFDKYDKLFG